MKSQVYRKTTKNQETFDPEFEELIQPTEPPEYWPDEIEADGFPKTKLKFGVGWRVPYAILAHCLKGDYFSIADLFGDMELSKDRPKDWLRVIEICSKGDHGLNLWWRDGFFLPCRENASKAVACFQGPVLRGTTSILGFQDVPALVAAINALPSGLELMARDRQPDTAAE